MGISASQEKHFCVFGMSGAGKTSILLELDAYGIPTIPAMGYCPETMTYKNMKLTTLCLEYIDEASKMSGLIRHYYENSDGIVLVVDCTDEDSWKEAKGYLNQLLSKKELKGLPLLIFAHKQDLPNAFSVEVLESEIEITDRTFHCQPSTIKKRRTILQGFEWLNNQEINNEIVVDTAPQRFAKAKSARK